MKLLIASGYNPFQIGSGPSNGLYYLSKSLAANGCENSSFSRLKTGELDNRIIVHYYHDALKYTPLVNHEILFYLSIKQINQICNDYKH